jgi:hypothetical protein
MSTLSTTTAHDTGEAAVHPVADALTGAAAFTVSVVVGELLRLRLDPADAPALKVTDVAFSALVLGAAVVLAAGLSARAITREPEVIQHLAVGMSVGAGVGLVAFWSGWPSVLGVVAAMLALEHRRQVGHFLPTTAAAGVIGTLAAAAATVLCVIS